MVIRYGNTMNEIPANYGTMKIDCDWCHATTEGVHFCLHAERWATLILPGLSGIPPCHVIRHMNYCPYNKKSDPSECIPQGEIEYWTFIFRLRAYVIKRLNAGADLKTVFDEINANPTYNPSLNDVDCMGEAWRTVKLKEF